MQTIGAFGRIRSGLDDSGQVMPPTMKAGPVWRGVEPVRLNMMKNSAPAISVHSIVGTRARIVAAGCGSTNAGLHLRHRHEEGSTFYLDDVCEIFRDQPIS